VNQLYSISGWDEHYEKSQSKRAKTHHWVAMPCKHDGSGYRRITIQPNSSELFAAWCLIVQVGAKCKTRGVLADTDGVPLDAEDLAIKTGFPVSMFDNALKFFSSGKIKWLIRHDSERAPSETEKTPSETGNAPTKKPHSTVQYRTDNTTPTEDVAENLKSTHPEHEEIKNCKPLSKITIERYAEIKHSFPKVNARQAVFLACLKAGSPETVIKSADGFLRSQFQYAPDADPIDIPYALGGKKIRMNDDGSRNDADYQAFRKSVI